MTTTELDKKIIGMSAADFVDALIAGLERQWLPLNMGGYLERKTEADGTVTLCGCAATNALCEIAKKPIAVYGNAASRASV